jgi:hypothetical protein
MDGKNSEAINFFNPALLYKKVFPYPGKTFFMRWKKLDSDPIE